MPSSSQPKKQTHSLQWVLLGEDLVISPTFEGRGESPVQFPEGPIAKGLGLVLGYLFMVSQTNLSALEQSWLPGSQWCIAIGKIGLH